MKLFVNLCSRLNWGVRFMLCRVPANPCLVGWQGTVFRNVGKPVVDMAILKVKQIVCLYTCVWCLWNISSCKLTFCRSWHQKIIYYKKLIFYSSPCFYEAESKGWGLICLKAGKVTSLFHDKTSNIWKRWVFSIFYKVTSKMFIVTPFYWYLTSICLCSFVYLNYFGSSVDSVNFN